MKKINKNIKFLLALSLFLSTGTPVLARTEIQHPTNEAIIPVNTFIGDFDNTNPESPNPIDPEYPGGNNPNHPNWLNVSVPTAVAFTGTEVVGNYRELTSSVFTINNYSGRAVNVYVNGFNGDDTSIIRELNVNQISVIENGEFTDLTDSSRLLYNIPGNTNHDFGFTGRAMNQETPVAPGFDLVLGFRVAGNVANPVD